MSTIQRASVAAVVLGLVSALLCTQSLAQTTARDPEREKAKIVSRTYQMTYGSVERCKHATPAAAEEFQKELARFVKQNAALMKQVTESPHYAKAREHFAPEQKVDPAKDSPEDLAGECKFLAALMRSMLDTPDGIQSVKKNQETLSK
jgi:hypothetical protein